MTPEANAALTPQLVITCNGTWCAHADDKAHAERLRVMFDEACGADHHRVEVWSKMDADEAMETAEADLAH